MTALRKFDVTGNAAILSATDDVLDFNERDLSGDVEGFVKSDTTDDCAVVDECDAAGKRNATGNDSDLEESGVTRDIPAFGECDESDDVPDNDSDFKECDAASNSGDFEVKTSLC